MSNKVLLLIKQFRCLFLSASLVVMYSLGMFGGTAKWTRIFWGMPKCVGIFGVKIQGQKGAYVADKSESIPPTPAPPPPGQ